MINYLDQYAKQLLTLTDTKGFIYIIQSMAAVQHVQEVWGAVTMSKRSCYQEQPG